MGNVPGFLDASSSRRKLYVIISYIMSVSSFFRYRRYIVILLPLGPVRKVWKRLASSCLPWSSASLSVVAPCPLLLCVMSLMLSVSVHWSSASVLSCSLVISTCTLSCSVIIIFARILTKIDPLLLLPWRLSPFYYISSWGKNRYPWASSLLPLLLENHNNGLQLTV